MIRHYFDHAATSPPLPEALSAKFRRPLAWGLAAFIVLVLVLGGIRFCAGGPGTPADHVMLGLEPDADAVVVALFRSDAACPLCESLKGGIGRVLAAEDPVLAGAAIGFREIGTQSAVARRFQLDHDAFGSVVVFFRVRDGEIIEGRVVEEAWPVAYRPEALDATLGEALREFLP